MSSSSALSTISIVVIESVSAANALRMRLGDAEHVCN